MISTTLMGGIGNTLFQISAALAHSWRHGFDCRIPMKINNPHSPGQVPYISPNIKYTKNSIYLPIYKEKGFEYEEIPPLDNICLDGYWQSFKYFDDYREQILRAFNFKWELKKDYCSVHIRLGDYLEFLDHHPPITQTYLFEAMMNVMTRVKDWEAVKFLVFSDSMILAKEMLSPSEFTNIPIEYCTEQNPVKALELMSSCEHNIMANSVFSWWGNYLNQNPDKISVAPALWFGKELPHNTKDLHIPSTLIL